MAVVEARQEILTYFSDRLRFERLYNDLPAAEQTVVRQYQCFSRSESILAGFPLPVNRPSTDVSIDGTAIPVFTPGDVFRLPDGRFGAMVGTITTAALTDPAAISTSDTLTFVAFTEAGGRYYIDEFFTVVSADMARIDASGWNGMLPTNCGA